MPTIPFSWTRSRYAKGLEAVRPRKDASGFMTRETRLCEHFARRYSNRERAYLMTVQALDRMLKAYQRGADASPITGELRE